MSTDLIIRARTPDHDFASVFGNTIKMAPLIFPIYQYCLKKGDPEFYLGIFWMAGLPIEKEDWLSTANISEIPPSEFRAIYAEMKAAYANWRTQWPHLASTEALTEGQERSWQELLELME